MSTARTTDVLVAGGGPTGMTAAVELRRREVDCRIVEQLAEPMLYAKAVGVQPRTLEVFEGMGIVRAALDEAVTLRGQVVFAEGAEVARLDIPTLPDIPFGFVGIPQYATERVLDRRLRSLGTTVERGVRLTGFTRTPTASPPPSLARTATRPSARHTSSGPTARTASSARR